MGSDSLCLVCTDSMDVSVLECTCLICTNCLSGWLTYHAQDHFLTGNKNIRCPNEACDKKYALDTLLPKLSIEERDKISDLLLRNYIHEAPDIVNCRKSSCNYSGFIASESCSNDLYCDLCGHKWKERSQMSTMEKAFFTLYNLRTTMSELQTAFYHLLYTVQCPRCSIPIRKMGGCDHMVCKKCSHEFCWECKQEFMYHSKHHCMANKYAKNFAVGFVFFYLAILMDLYLTFWNFWMGAFKLILKLLLLNSAFLVLFLLIYPILRIIKEEESIFQDRLKSIWYVSWFSVMAYITYWHMHYLLYNYLGELLWATCVEIVLAWLVRSVDHLVQTWLKFVF